MKMISVGGEAKQNPRGLSVTCDGSVVFSGSTVFLHQ